MLYLLSYLPTACTPMIFIRIQGSLPTRGRRAISSVTAYPVQQVWRLASLVDEVGFEPTLYLTSRIYSPLPSPLGLLIHKYQRKELYFPLYTAEISMREASTLHDFSFLQHVLHYTIAQFSPLHFPSLVNFSHSLTPRSIGLWHSKSVQLW